MIHTQGLRHGVVGEGAHHDVLATVVADDVRHFEIGLCSRIEGILAVHLTIGVSHAFGIDLAAEVALRRGDLNVLIIGVSAFRHTDLHLGHVADDGRDRELGKVGSTGFKHRGHLGDGHDLLDAIGGVHSSQVEAAQREVDHDLLLAARHQLDHWICRSIAANACPTLGVCHY